MIYISETLLCRFRETLSAVLGSTSHGQSLRPPISSRKKLVQGGGGLGETIRMLVVAAILAVIGTLALDIVGLPITDARGLRSLVVHGRTMVRAAPGVPPATSRSEFESQVRTWAPRVASDLLSSDPPSHAGLVTLRPDIIEQAQLKPLLYHGFVRDVIGGSTRGGSSHCLSSPPGMLRLGVDRTNASRMQTVTAPEGHAEGPHLDLDPRSDDVDIALFDHTSVAGERSPMNDLFRLPALGTLTSPPPRAPLSIGFLGIGPGAHSAQETPFFFKRMRWVLNVDAEALTGTVTVTPLPPPENGFGAGVSDFGTGSEEVIARALTQQIAAAFSAGMLPGRGPQLSGTSNLFTVIGFRGNTDWHIDKVGKGNDPFDGVLSITAGLSPGDGTGSLATHQVRVSGQEATSGRVVRMSPEDTAAQLEAQSSPFPTVWHTGVPEVAVQAKPKPGVTLLLRQREADAGYQTEHGVFVNRREVDPHRQHIVFTMKVDRHLTQIEPGTDRYDIPVSVQRVGLSGGGRKRRRRRTRRLRPKRRTRRPRRVRSKRRTRR